MLEHGIVCIDTIVVVGVLIICTRGYQHTMHCLEGCSNWDGALSAHVVRAPTPAKARGPLNGSSALQVRA